MSKDVDIIKVLEDLEKEKGIAPDVIIEAIKAALESGYKKNYGKSNNFSIEIDQKTGGFKMYTDKEIVEVVEDNQLQISLEDARKMSKKNNVGDIIKVEIQPKNDFGRIAAQTARQVILQKIREAEREGIFKEYEGREGDLINGTVQRINKGNIYVEIVKEPGQDAGKIDGIILPTEQIPGESFKQGDKIKAVILDVKNTGKGANILLSRTHPNYVKRLFELEVPEIADGVLDIYSISREAGSRTKIAIYSNDSNVDPVGSCVGNKGIRVKTIIDDINGEKIDIVVYSKDYATFIANSLGPAKIVDVFVNEEEKSAVAIVPDNQLSLAIGKEGQNARLAAKLTGWKIDIKSESQYGYNDDEDYDDDEYYDEDDDYEEDDYNEEDNDSEGYDDEYGDEDYAEEELEQ